ncbi:hypothetical protein B7494_g4845 [Chlorociboria aeruginascens]|nr:hypothetical protein B7494_g4845 [Chlorociboria aeruginascens]
MVPKYAILSYTWLADDDEITFDDLTEASAQHETDEINFEAVIKRNAKPKSTGYRKIQFCLEQAAKYGLKYSWIDKWFDGQVKKGHPWSTIQRAHSKLGPLVRIGPEEASVASSEGLRAVYTAGLDRDSSYSFFQSFETDNLLSMQDSKTHSLQKRMISLVYSKSYLQHSPDMKTISREIIGERFLPLLARLTTSEEDGNIMLLAQWVGMDMMTAYLFGLENGTNWLRNQADADKYLAELEMKKDDASHGKYSEDVCMSMCKAARSFIRERENGETRPIGFEKLYKPLEEILIAEGKPEEYIMKRTASEMMDEMLASHLPTSITLTYAVWHLSQDAELQKRLREELTSLTPRILPNVQEGDDYDLPSASVIDSLPLLNCVLTETLRLHAAVPGVQPRIVPAGGITLHDTFLPAGTTISSNAFTLHRDETVFPDAQSWRPERWAHVFDTTHPSDDAIPMRRSFWAFGSGGKMCLGNNFARQMLKLVLTSIYSNYTTTIVDDEGIEQAETALARPKGNKLVVKFHLVRY